MPIRFRCAYCNQLMGIATRKAGKVVRCPKCAGEIIVPTPEGAPPHPPEPQPLPGPRGFDAPDFEEHLQAANETADVDVDLMASPEPPLLEPEHDPHELTAPPQRGLFLTPIMLAALAAAILVILAGAFVAGYFVGKGSAPVAAADT